MGENSKIEWTHHTFNPWLGCTKVSPACANCYAEAWAKRTGIVKWGDSAERRKTTESYWRQPLKWNAQAFESVERKRVFCASLADVFEDRPEIAPWRKELFDLINATPYLDWLLLTKRPQNIAAMLKASHAYGDEFPPNAWLGTTVESDDQSSRVDDLIEAGGAFASVLFLSCEPLLGPLNLKANQRWQMERGGYRPLIDDIQWVIAGGESGAHARPSHPDWFRNLRDQCVAAGVAFHFKQWGEWQPRDQYQGSGMPMLRNRVRIGLDGDTEGPHGMPITLREPRGMYRVGKKAAGRLLDGKEWNQFPGQGI